MLEQKGLCKYKVNLYWKLVEGNTLQMVDLYEKIIASFSTHGKNYIKSQIEVQNRIFLWYWWHYQEKVRIFSRVEKL